MTTDYTLPRALLNDPLTNKGTAFSLEDRDRYGLHGHLPSTVFTLDEQIVRRRQMLESMDTDFHRYAFLRELQDTNEVLFHAVIHSDLPRMLPLVYTPTVGEGCERFSQIFRRPRGLFLSWPNRHRIREILADPALDRVKVIVVSDGERILGLGDQGAGGMGIPIGKLALYTACAGLHPAEVLPILLDCGTDNEARLNDPMYIGWHSKRVRGADYDAFVEEFVSAVDERFPDVLLQWEDFAGKNAYDLLGRYRHRLLSFNDDIQGTAATAVGTLLSAVRTTEVSLSAQRFILYGVGAAGSGIAEMLVRAIMAEGVDEKVARATIWPIDRDGLILSDMPDLPPQQVPLARDPADITGWPRIGNGRIGLEQTIAHVRPTVLIGASGQRDAFNEGAIRLMASLTERPVIFPLSNPVSRAEARPADILTWSDNRAIVGSGSPFGTPGVTQVNNIYIFPGIGLGALAARASEVTDSMFMVAARRLGELSGEIGDGAAGGGAGLLPPITALREVALRIACAVAEQAMAEGVAQVPPEAITRDAIAAMMWEPEYA